MLSILFLTIIGFLLGAYLTYLALLFHFQEKFIFQKAKPELLKYEKLNSQAIKLTMRDGISIQGWRSNGKAHETELSKVLIYFGGNAQDVSSMLPLLKELNVKTVYLFNYRGYGLSEGVPSEKALYADALEIFDLIEKQHKKSELIVMGYSLGSAIAGHTAKQRLPSKLILLCPIHSVSQIAVENFYVPAFLTKHKFALHTIAKNIVSSTLVLIAENDSIVKPKHSSMTFENLRCEKVKYTIKNCDHNELFFTTESENIINNFISN